ncbi:DUF2058 domain-containing protein [Aestuariibacter sp. AA17]|uniref:DUF2058 domain-containing protein n=1 Tax=Fluctibacter corallii TaxID=2984329 RepID=A0ABT3A9U5_9ALTE|nr:DUF2058 domain-containing protein [Aestuariibacter sp. AA17]MCV2885369.1 DUF2058 domain-containing protein [Aestuariibacter sp. AA17]
MALSLQEQLLKAGLTDKKKAQQVKKEKHKKIKQKQKHKTEIVDENKIAAEKARVEKVEKDRQLNLKAKEEAEKKAVLAQIKQLITVNKQPKNTGDIACNFTDDNVVKRVMVDEKTHRRITLGKLAIVKLDEEYEIVPTPVADKLEQRDADIVLYRADKQQVEEAKVESAEEDEWYADYEIPDDLMW